MNICIFKNRAILEYFAGIYCTAPDMELESKVIFAHTKC